MKPDIICSILAALLSVYTIYMCSGKLFNPKRVATAVSAMKNVNTKTLSRLSHLQCINECITRKSCIFIYSSFRPDDVIGARFPYKCHLQMKDAGIPEEREKTCRRQYQLISVYPQAIAGACSDHKCSDGEICYPAKTGGYRCKPERGRRHSKAKKQKKYKKKMKAKILMT